MRIRYALAAATVGTALALGTMSMSAQAAPASKAAADAVTNATASTESSPASIRATWHQMDRYYWKVQCLADGVAATVGPDAFAIDYQCPVDASNPDYYRLWLLY